MKPFEEYSSQVKPDLQSVVAKLHKELLKIEPAFTHKKAWAGYGYKVGDNYSVLLTEYKDHLKVMIMRGTMLDDPTNLLEGTGTSTRHIKYFSVEDVAAKDLAPFLKQQFVLYESGVRWED